MRIASYVALNLLFLASFSSQAESSERVYKIPVLSDIKFVDQLFVVTPLESKVPVLGEIPYVRDLYQVRPASNFQTGRVPVLNQIPYVKDLFR